MSRMQEKRELPGALKTLAGVVIVFLLLATGYVIYQAGQVLFPPNTYETALLATVEDTVDAEGVLLFDESYVAGDGTLGYLVADGERVSAGTAVAEVYSDASQAALRQQLTQLGDQIDLLQKSQNTTSAQMETLRKDRSAALYNLMDSLDTADYEDTDAEKEDYLLAQNKLWVITGEVSSFSDQIAALVQQMSSVQAQLGAPTQITAPQTGYFIRSSSSGRLNAGMEDILALGAVDLKAYIESSPEIALDGCAGKIVSGFTWYYAGICSAKEGQKLLGTDGRPLRSGVEIRFPGQAETPLKATLQEVNIDEENKKAEVFLKPEEVSLAIGRGGMNIKLASMLTEYTIDVFREVDENEADEDIYLDEFSDEIDQWVIDAIKGIGYDTAKQVLNAPRDMIVEKADLEEETVDNVLKVLRAEFEQ